MLPSVQTQVDDIFVHSRAEGGPTAMEVHLKHLRRVFEVMRANKLYANIDKCVFAAEEIKVLGCFVSKVGVHADLGKVKAIAAWPIPRSQKDLRKWLGLANYLHNSTLVGSLKEGYLLSLGATAPRRFRQRQRELTASASPGIAGRKQIIQLQAAESSKRNLPVHDKGLLAMKYALVKFRALYDLHGSRVLADSHKLAAPTAADDKVAVILRESCIPRRIQPGQFNVLADVLSCRSDYEQAHVSRGTTNLYDLIRLMYQAVENYTRPVRFLSDGKDAEVDRLDGGHSSIVLSWPKDPRDPPRVVVPNKEDLKYDILLEAHVAPIGGHFGREKTYQAVSQTFWWSRMYKWVAHYVKTCETCQRLKPSGHASASLQSLPVPADCRKSMSLDFVFGPPADDKGNTGILVFVYRLSKMVHLAPVRDKGIGKQTAQLFLDSMFRCHDLSETIVSDRDPRFTGAFWDILF
ncbi:Putative retroelement [Phytophthora palmivora]|uniref:Retroelement n=1 Tax=Phytophthora palmivora TaxID=4796 RepID=A0A2P4Y3Z7_9STRA|nr:Putative retroelement [Phytophthora palmivora]